MSQTFGWHFLGWMLTLVFGISGMVALLEGGWTGTCERARRWGYGITGGILLLASFASYIYLAPLPRIW